MTWGWTSWARGAALTFAAGLGCSLLAPSSESLSGAYAEADLDAASSEAAAPCPLGTKACAGGCASIGSPAVGCAAASCEPCAAAHAGAICVGGACALGPCENGWANCNERAEDGCEVDTRESAAYCGSCLVSCAGATPRCQDGACVPRCHAVKTTSVAAHVALPATNLGFGAGDFTVELWVARHGDFDGTQGALFTTNEGYAANAVVVDFTPESVRCRVNEAVPTGRPAVAAPSPQDLAWHHLACVRDAGVLALYLDGTRRSALPMPEVVLAATSAALGRPAGTPTYAAPPARIGPVRISRRARYTATFRPRAYWTVDADTVVQLLTSRGFDGVQLVDEAGGDDTSLSAASLVASEDIPCP